MTNSNTDHTDWKIPLYKIYSDDEDIQQITKIIKRGNGWAIGPEIIEFENAIKNYIGTDYCLTLNSGTSALHASLLAYGFGKSDDIIVPSFSFISTANSVLFVGSNPIFADIEEITFGLDPINVSTKINSATKAIIPMDYGGMSCNIFDIKELAKKHNLALIEDAAESLGAKINNRKVGSVSDIAIFSFCGNKVLTTGEGGAITTNSKELYEKIKLIRSHGRNDKVDYFNNSESSEYSQLGYNWRMSSITAALGLSQIQKLDKIIKKRQENATYLSSKLSKFKEIKTPVIPKNYDHIFQMYTIRLTNQEIRDKLHHYLTKNRIFSKVYFNPIHQLKFYQEKLRNQKIQLPITEKVSKEILTIPLYPNMNNEEKDYLINSISEFFESEN